MHSKLIAIALIFVFIQIASPQQAHPGSPLKVEPLVATGRNLAVSSYMGGSGEDQGRGITADSQGNFYAVGGTASPNFPIKNGTPVNTLKPSDPNCPLNMDAYVTKFSSTGQLLWSTALGASNYDRAYDVVTDLNGNVYVSGREVSGSQSPPARSRRLSSAGFRMGTAQTTPGSPSSIPAARSSGPALLARRRTPAA